MAPAEADVKAIDAVVNLWTEEALRLRPDWGHDFFVDKMKSSAARTALTLEQMLERMAAAGVERGFLVAARTGRLGLKGSYHMPYEIVARACEKFPGRFYGLAGVDPTQGMSGLRAFEDAVQNMGFIGAHFYPHWFEIAPDHARMYPFYAKCCELGVPIQMQVGQSMVYSKDQPTRSVGRPVALDGVACDFPELKLIGIHIGIPWADEMIAMAWKHDNVFIAADAHSPKYWPESFVRYLASYGQDKVLWGTDFPILDWQRTLDEVAELGLKPDVRAKFLRGNALRVYGLEK